jgi:hypothetical protein
VRSLVMTVSFGFRAAFSAAAVDRVAQTLVGQTAETIVTPVTFTITG